MQLVVGKQDGTTTSFEINEDQEQALMGLEIGDEFEGSVVGLTGYTLKITGGSDEDGFPMKRQLQGTGRKRVLLKEGAGAQGLEDGERIRRSVRGNTVADDIVQLNCSVVEEGDESIAGLLGREESDEDEETDEEEASETDEENDEEGD
ncbi:MAG: 30S ribosomal protein S6e [Candidatus Nanohaloarchaea archaeon]|nr:30S ribosomal protein S6e [Candidatus Nanohaloarchaea archaeon]